MRPFRLPIPVRSHAISVLLAIAAVLSPATVLPTNGSERLSEAESRRASRDLARWLEQDCEEVNLTALTRYKQAIVPDLIAALEKGAPAEKRELVRQGAEASYKDLFEQSQRKRERPLASGRDAYVKRDMDNFEGQYRARAAQALAAIGGADARNALESILAKARRDEVPVREDVRRAIQEYLSWTR